MAAEMERWRSFFAQAEADLWTVIDQAIFLAAKDFPAEFKHKRCEIAEILFQRRPCPSPTVRSMDVTILSGSVITNSTGDAEQKAFYQTSWENNAIRQCRTSRLDIKATDKPSQGTALRSSSEEGHCQHRDKSVEQVSGLRCHNEPNAISSAAHGPTSDLTVLQNVTVIKDQIMDCTDQSDDGILRSLRSLECLDITVEILKATDIGREVNKFRKHLSGPVQNLAKQLVRTWKGMVDEWVKKSEAVLPFSAPEDQCANRAISASKHSKLQQDCSEHKSSQAFKQPLNKPSNNSSMVHKSAVQSYSQVEHAVEDMGSNRVETDDIYRHGCLERKNPSTLDQRRQDGLKRGLQEGRLEEHAKKQRDAPLSSYPEFCKKNVITTRLPTSTSAKSQHSTQRR